MNIFRIILYKLLDSTVGLFVFSLFLVQSCSNSKNESKKNVFSYLEPVDSVGFKYESETRNASDELFSENRYGHFINTDVKGNYTYLSINSQNQFHTFNFKSNLHTYSKAITDEEIEAFKIDSSKIYLLYNNFLFVKNHKLKTLDSFPYRKPIIEFQHKIDSDIANGANLFKIQNYFVVLYYVIDKKGIYRNNDHLFYYFNRDTSFFATKMSSQFLNEFQYFRYPAVVSNDNELYFAPRTLNLISKTDETENSNGKEIDSENDNYLSFRHNDQYQISKLKKYRFSTDYNKDILIEKNSVLLLKEFPSEIKIEKKLQVYNRDLELIEYTKALLVKRKFYIRDHIYFFAHRHNGKLILFNLQKNKYYVYQI